MWDGEYGVLDAIIQYEPGKAFNVWMGRMLTPADRIEMNGPLFLALTFHCYPGRKKTVTVTTQPSNQVL